MTDQTAAHAPPSIAEVEQYGIFGPDGPRFVRSADAAPPPIPAARR